MHTVLEGKIILCFVLTKRLIKLKAKIFVLLVNCVDLLESWLTILKFEKSSFIFRGSSLYTEQIFIYALSLIIKWKIINKNQFSDEIMHALFFYNSW